MGQNMHDVYEAIFEAEPDDVEEDEELFSDREQDRTGLHSWASHEHGRNGTNTPPQTPMPPQLHIPESPTRASRRASSIPRSIFPPGQSSSSPRARKLSLRPSLAEHLRTTAAESQGLSPLTRLFGSRRSEVEGGPSPVEKLDKVEEGVRRVQELLEDLRELPVAKLKEEMRELQERQTRIEGLLLMLTRGMRNETSGTAGPSRYDTL